MKAKVALIGFPTCGKTTVGQLVARTIQWNFIDTDRLVEQQCPSLSYQEIFQQFGEDYFRSLEEQALRKILPMSEIVIAAGGGIILSETNRLWLRQYTHCIYLHTTLAVLKQRIWSKPVLPAYLDPKDPERALSDLYTQRVPLYEACAHVVIETDQQKIDQIVNQVVNWIYRNIFHIF